MKFAFTVLLLFGISLTQTWAAAGTPKSHFFMTSLPGWANRSVLELSRETGRIARAAEAETARLYRLPAETQVICRAVLSSIDVTPNEAVEIQGTLICQSAAHDLEDLDWRLLIEDRLTQVMGYTFFAFPPVGGAGTIHN